MSAFYDLIDEHLGEQDDITDIRVVVRRCYFYDLEGYQLRLWQGQGRLFTSDGNEWLGTIDGNGKDHHVVPSIQDGRDGTSATYEFGLTIPSLPGEASPAELYEQIKAEQSVVAGRTLTIYLAVWHPDLQHQEGLRPTTPIVFFRQLNLFTPKFSEKLVREVDGRFVKQYSLSVPAKDDNFGRSAIPNGTYTDTVQKRRAAALGVANDRGCEYVALLANRTMQIP